MIRSLFLIGILMTLVAIAFKRPDQSALEFAQEVSEKAQASITAKLPESMVEAPPLPAPSLKEAPPVTDNWRAIPKVNQTVVKRVEDRRPDAKKPAKTDSPAILPPPIPKQERLARQELLPKAPSFEDLLPPKVATNKRIDAPPMPRAPVLKVVAEPLNGLERTGEKSVAKPLKLTDPGLVEVRANLENAARLLAQVK